MTAARWLQLRNRLGPPITHDEEESLAWMVDYQHSPIYSWPLTYTVIDFGIRTNFRDKVTFDGTCQVQCDSCHKIYIKLTINVRANGFTCRPCVDLYKSTLHGTAFKYLSGCRCDECRLWKHNQSQRSHDKAKLKAQERKGNHHVHTR